MRPRLRRSSLLAGAVVLIVGIGAAGVSLLWRAAEEHFTTAECSFGDYSLDPTQASVAATMVGVVTSRGLPERAAVLVLAAGLQESKLRNLPPGAGDRDSVGVLQQRPSQGWGTNADLNDLNFATGAFLDALTKLPSWQTLPLATAVQDVQISADGSAYAPHEPEAQAIADRLTGKPPAGVTCSFAAPKVVATTAAVAAALTRDLPVNPPSVTATTVRVPGAAWQTAAWFVANADRLGIDSVAFSGKRWTRSGGWRGYAAASAAAVLATMHVLKR